MSNKSENKNDWDYYIERAIKAFMIESLEGNNWVEQMKLKARTYIKNNGTKSISVDEVVDFLKEDALKSFPEDIQRKTEDELKEMMESLMNG